MKKFYIKSIIIIKYVFFKLKILKILEKNLSISWILYIRSLFSIYDIEDLFYLDLPFWTFNSIKYVDKFLQNLNGKAVVFEYGPGASTIWLSKRCMKIYFVEHNLHFFNYLKN